MLDTLRFLDLFLRIFLFIAITPVLQGSLGRNSQRGNGERTVYSARVRGVATVACHRVPGRGRPSPAHGAPAGIRAIPAFRGRVLVWCFVNNLTMSPQL